MSQGKSIHFGDVVETGTKLFIAAGLIHQLDQVRTLRKIQLEGRVCRRNV